MPPLSQEGTDRPEGDGSSCEAAKPSPLTEGKKIVIIGGGVIGCCIAYYLTRHRSFDQTRDSITILEASKIAGGSSGKAGGLLAAWAEPECLAPQSFKLQADLAKEHGGEKRWGYRNVYCAKGAVDLESIPTPADADHIGALSGTVSLPTNLDWVKPEVFRSYEVCGNTSNTAQVHPYLFTTAMAELAQEVGASIKFCTVRSINKNTGERRVTSVTCKDDLSETLFDISATEVVVAAGPWTSSVYPKASVGGARGHSIVVKPFTSPTDHCLDIRTRSRLDYWSESDDGPTIVEIYPRPDGTLYACAFCDTSVPLPSTSLSVKPNEATCQTIFNTIKAMSEVIDKGELLVQQACFQPVVLHNGKRRRCVGSIIGPADIDGLYLALAHDSWGIQNGPATGKAVAELIYDGESRVADLYTSQLETVLQRARSGEEAEGS